MKDALSAPAACLTVITLGVGEMRASSAFFYGALGFTRKFRATGEEVAFFETGGAVLGLYPWSKLALDAAMPDQSPPTGFRGMTLAWNCRSTEKVDAVLAFALANGATLLKSAHRTDYGGHSGYFAETSQGHRANRTHPSQRLRHRGCDVAPATL